VLRLKDPDVDVAVEARELTDEAARHRIAAEAWRVQPWYAEQPYSIQEWVIGSPMVTLTPIPPQQPPG
jgi:hypothetical protein